MTRFKELRRIEMAIAERNLAELEWSRDYCKMRLRIAPNKHHIKSWQKRLNKVVNTVEEFRHPMSALGQKQTSR
jgi:hypothetical protein